MMVPLFSVPSNLQPSPWGSPYAQQRSSRRSRRNSSSEASRQEGSALSADLGSNVLSQDAFWGVLLESMPIGVMVLASSLQIVYCNDKAKNFCDRLQNSARDELPTAICGLCQRLMQEESASAEPLILEYQGKSDQFFRLQARWMNLATQPLLLVLLEDCHESLRTELEIEQDKYDLTDREAEIWFLLRQKYPYQDISDLLNISLNTVKTHVKNIYAKRKNLAGARKIWYSR